MTKAQRKVAIAKDVIANLHVMKIKSENGYINSNNSNFNNVIYTELEPLLEFGITPQQIAQKGMESCSMCARGALMLTKVAKFDQYDFDGVCSLGYIDQDDTLDALKDAFTGHELELIETFFEGSNYITSDNNYYDGLGLVTDLGLKVQGNWTSIWDDKDRLLAIMQNIIDHKGEFKPEVKYVIYYK